MTTLVARDRNLTLIVLLCFSTFGSCGTALLSIFNPILQKLSQSVSQGLTLFSFSTGSSTTASPSIQQVCFANPFHVLLMGVLVVSIIDPSGFPTTVKNQNSFIASALFPQQLKLLARMRYPLRYKTFV
jgi:hypothetical protein